jgi:hypothetical protein
MACLVVDEFDICDLDKEPINYNSITAYQGLRSVYILDHHLYSYDVASLFDALGGTHHKSIDIHLESATSAYSVFPATLLVQNF